MRNQIRKCGSLTVAALLCFAAGAFAQQNVTVTYQGDPSDSGPQTAAVGGVTMTVISTDFADNTSANGGTWTAVEENVGTGQINSLDPAGINTMFGGNISSNIGAYSSTFNSSCGSANCELDAQQVYQLAAYLGSAMVACSTGCQYSQTDYQDALWSLFDMSYTPPIAEQTNVGNILSSLNYSMRIGNSTLFSNVLVLSPDINSVDPPCLSGDKTSTNCGDPEFLAFTSTPTVTTPETSAPLLLGADFLGLACLAFLFRRRLIRVKT